jgi:hypothetical protein
LGRLREDWELAEVKAEAWTCSALSQGIERCGEREKARVSLPVEWVEVRIMAKEGGEGWVGVDSVSELDILGKLKLELEIRSRGPVSWQR